MAELRHNTIDAEKNYKDVLLTPAGEYVAMIVGSEMKQTRAGNGSYLELRWQVLEGMRKGEEILQRLNLENPSERTVAIAQRTLNSVCFAIGKQELSDSNELHNTPCKIHVKVKAGQDGYEDQSEVVKIEKLQESPL